MPTSFSLTLDSTNRSLVLVAGERIIDDVTDIRITRTAAGFDCEVVRAGGVTPTRLVASASLAGRQALERANGKLSSVPGFVEVALPISEINSSALRQDIAALLGWERPDGEQEGPPG